MSTSYRGICRSSFEILAEILNCKEENKQKSTVIDAWRPWPYVSYLLLLFPVWIFIYLQVLIHFVDFPLWGNWCVSSKHMSCLAYWKDLFLSVSTKCYTHTCIFYWNFSPEFRCGVSHLWYCSRTHKALGLGNSLTELSNHAQNSIFNSIYTVYYSLPWWISFS